PPAARIARRRPTAPALARGLGRRRVRLLASRDGGGSRRGGGLRRPPAARRRLLPPRPPSRGQLRTGADPAHCDLVRPREGRPVLLDTLRHRAGDPGRHRRNRMAGKTRSNDRFVIFAPRAYQPSARARLRSPPPFRNDTAQDGQPIAGHRPVKAARTRGRLGRLQSRDPGAGSSTARPLASAFRIAQYRFRTVRRRNGARRTVSIPEPAWSRPACILCYVNCGLEVATEGRTITRVRGDKANARSHGYLCQKAQRLQWYGDHADRLTSPLRRRPDGTHEPISWETAFTEIAARLNAIRAEHGGEAFAVSGGGGPGHHPRGTGLLARRAV